MKRIALIILLLTVPVQAQASCAFLFFGCHRAHHRNHHHRHHHPTRVIVKKKVEKIIVEKPAAPVIIEKHKLLPLDPVK